MEVTEQLVRLDETTEHREVLRVPRTRNRTW
jgi:hypothetical protein